MLIRELGTHLVPFPFFRPDVYVSVCVDVCAHARVRLDLDISFFILISFDGLLAPSFFSSPFRLIQIS
jgi:hypothetical protein